MIGSFFPPESLLQLVMYLEPESSLEGHIQKGLVVINSSINNQCYIFVNIALIFDIIYSAVFHYFTIAKWYINESFVRFCKVFL